ncbi:hypothetical protein LINPERHAP1_LOCUS6750 [Linum perenne]
MDKWIPEAGSSNVLGNQGVIWITINGIPLHLRSTDLFRHLGEFCGSFLGYELTGSLSSVRIKVLPRGEFPDSIPICSGNSIFHVRVSRPSQPPFTLDYSSTSPPIDQSIIGKSTLQPISSSDLFSAVNLEIGSSSDSTSPLPPVFNITPRIEELSTRQDGPSPDKRPLLAGSEVSVASTHSPREGRNYIGFQLDIRGRLLFVSSAGQPKTTPLILLDSSGDPFGFKFSHPWDGLFGPLSPGKCRQMPHKFGLGPFDSSLSSPVVIPLILNHPTATQPLSFSDFLLLEGSTPISPPATPDNSSSSSGHISLSSSVSDMAVFFGLELDGD